MLTRTRPPKPKLTLERVSLAENETGRSRARRAPGVDPKAVEFQPDPLAIEERPLPVMARSTIYVVALLIVSAFVWASLAKIDRVVVGRGKLITVDPLMVVQPLETAVVRTINVGIGDRVKAGDVLATLDPTFTESAELANREKLNSMNAEVERLEAEIGGGTYPSAQASRDSIYVRLQSEIYEHRQAEYWAAVAASDSDASRLEAALVTNRASQAGLRERIAVLGDIEKMRDELYGRSAGSLLNLLQARLDRLSLSDQLTERSATVRLG